MPLRLNIGLSKKLGLPDYGSLGASCNVDIELDAALLQTDPEAFQRHARNACDACRRAVQEELARHQAAPATTPASNPPVPSWNVGGNATGNGNGHASGNGKAMSPSAIAAGFLLAGARLVRRCSTWATTAHTILGTTAPCRARSRSTVCMSMTRIIPKTTLGCSSSAIPAAAIRPTPPSRTPAARS